jgi:hypothetical protein
MYSLWFTIPPSFAVNKNTFITENDWSSLFHEMGHNYTLNFPSTYRFGGKVDGAGSGIYSETMAQIFQHATAYEIINRAKEFGIPDDIKMDIELSAVNTVKYLKSCYDNYVSGGMKFSTFNDPSTPEDETFLTFMTAAYKFLEHVEKAGNGYRMPVKRLMEFFSSFNPDIEKKYDSNNGSITAQTFRATYIVAGFSYALKEDLRDEFKKLNFPIDDKEFSELLPIKVSAIPPTVTLPTINGVNLDVPGAVITTNSGTFSFTVSAYDESGIGRMVVKVNGVVQIDKNNLDPTIYLSEGVNTVEVTVYDTAGNYTTKSFKVISDTKPPVIDVTLPETVSSQELTVKGTVVDLVTGVQSVTVNDNPVILTLEGNFETKLALSPGANTVIIEATDNVGNKSTKSFTVSYIQPQAKQSYIVILKVGDPNITVNGISQKIDAQGSKPIIKNGRTLLPIRTLIESLGGQVLWDAREQKVTITLNGHSIVLWIGKTTALVDGSKTTLDVAPIIINGRTYLPLRFISENLGASVNWDDKTQTITIYYWP